MITIDFAEASGLGAVEREKLQKLQEIFTAHVTANFEKNRYYEGKISLNEVNIGIALPDGIRKLEIGCAWGAKTVDVLAGLSQFDGFVGENGVEVPELQEIVAKNRLISEYMKACRDELKFGCTFATLSAAGKKGCRIRFHSPQTAAALWDGQKGRIDCGFAIIDSKHDILRMEEIPVLVNFYTDDAIWVLRRNSDADTWKAERYKNKMGRPLMEPLVWNATSKKPLGRSRIKEPIRRLIQGYVRTIANATIGLEFATSPQKYLLGVTDEQYDMLISQKFKQYVGSIIASTNNPETGQKPEFGQLPQGSIAPHVEMIRVLATQFSAATGLTVTDTGVVNDANPTSSEAILAQSRTLTGMAEQLNAGNGDALREIALMAIAITNNTTLEALTEEQKSVVAHFKNPAMPSISVTADAAVKIAGSDPDFAQTDVFYEMLGFDQADIRRIKAQKTRARGLRVLDEIENEDTGEDVENLSGETEPDRQNGDQKDDRLYEQGAGGTAE
ncbi:MAG: phage portal protein [Lachnospiraceae bacterium]|nr:phage portal protein [Lachnospiraceae bacterium]